MSHTALRVGDVVAYSGDYCAAHFPQGLTGPVTAVTVDGAPGHLAMTDTATATDWALPVGDCVLVRRETS